jgi:ATP-binding cassette, subfamily B, multidrug efflux pump
MEDKEAGISEGKAVDFKLFKRIFRYTLPYRTIFGFCVFLTISLSALNITRPLLILYTINNFVVNPNPEMLKSMTLLLMGLLLVEACFQFLNSYLTSVLGQNIIRDMRAQLFRHIVSLKPSFFDKTPIGMLVTRAVSDIEAIEEIFSQGFIVIAGDILTLLVFVVAMFWVDWKLTLVALSTLPLLLVSTWLFKNAVKKAFQDVRNQVARLNTFVQEHITGIKIVQIFTREKKESENFREINAAHRDANIRSIYYSVFFPVAEILSSISIGFLVWQAGKDIFTGRVEQGHVLFFIMLVNMFYRPIRMLADRVNTLQMGMVAGERVFRVLDTKEHIQDSGSLVAENLRGEVEFKNVNFSYKPGQPVLKNISFRAEPGKMLAIVGATGSGKTTVINLLNRFYDIESGSILIDGTDIRTFKLESLRKEIGVVLQDVFLFSDTIFNNITLFNPDITPEQVEEAALEIGAMSFIKNLPGGLDFHVRERGAMLSVGQRQLIAFLRARVARPSILVMDEATSSVDTESELLIQKAGEKLTEGRTSIVIAHRLSTIQRAHNILVMNRGEIVESGNHQELIAGKGIYRKLFELQYKGQEASV